jgi:tetratricopeptide (TPR) repeat protein
MRVLIFCLIFISLLSGCSVFHKGYHQKDGGDVWLSATDRELYNYSFTEATKQKLISNYSQAINLFFKCLEINPNSSAAYYQLSDIYFSNGDKERALVFARMAASLNSGNVWYNLQLARIYQSLGKKDSTIFVYKRIVKTNKKKYEYLFNLAILYVDVGEYKKALNILIDLQDMNGLNEELVLAFYQVYSGLNDHKSCERVLTLAIERFPEESKFYGLLAEYYASIGDYSSALTYYLELLVIYPDNEKGLLSIIEFFRVNNKYDESVRYARQFIESDKFGLQEKIEIIVSYLNDTKCFSFRGKDIKGFIDLLNLNYSDDYKVRTLRADYYVKTNDFVNAKNDLLYVVGGMENNYLVWEQLFYVLNNLCDYSSLLQFSDKVKDRFKDKPLIYLFRGISMFQMKRYDEAVSVFLAGLKYIGASNELAVQFYTFLGETYHCISDYDRSDSCFYKVLSIDPTNLYVLNNYSYYLAQRNQHLDVALNNIKKCLDIESSNSDYLITYGLVLMRREEFLDAKTVFERVIDMIGVKNRNLVEYYLFVLCKLKLTDLVEKYYKIYLEFAIEKSPVLDQMVHDVLN